MEGAGFEGEVRAIWGLTGEFAAIPATGADLAPGECSVELAQEEGTQPAAGRSPECLRDIEEQVGDHGEREQTCGHI